MGQLSLVPNLNLGRLIKDLLNEGGEGLYLHRVTGDDAHPLSVEQGRGRARGRDGSGDYRFALVTEQILVLKVCIISGVGYRTIIEYDTTWCRVPINKKTTYSQ